MQKVQFTQATRIALDGTGYAVMDAKVGDVAELPDAHAASLVSSGLAIVADPDADVTFTAECSQEGAPVVQETPLKHWLPAHGRERSWHAAASSVGGDE